MKFSLEIYSQLEMIALDNPELKSVFEEDRIINQDFFAIFTKGWEFLWMLRKQGVFLAALPKVSLYEYMSLDQKINTLRCIWDNLQKYDYWYVAYTKAKLEPKPICVHIKITSLDGIGEVDIVTLQQGYELIDPSACLHEIIWKIGYSDFLDCSCNLEKLNYFPSKITQAWREGYEFARNNTYIKDIESAWMVYSFESAYSLN